MVQTFDTGGIPEFFFAKNLIFKKSADDKKTRKITPIGKELINSIMHELSCNILYLFQS